MEAYFEEVEKVLAAFDQRHTVILDDGSDDDDSLSGSDSDDDDRDVQAKKWQVVCTRQIKVGKKVLATTVRMYRFQLDDTTRLRPRTCSISRKRSAKNTATETVLSLTSRRRSVSSTRMRT